jgi:hypothetical protein
MPKKEARVPSAHFMVTQLSRVLDSVTGHFFESVLHPRLIDPIGHVPMLLGYEF